MRCLRSRDHCSHTDLNLQLEKMDTRELAWKEYKNRLPSLNCKRIMVAKHFKTGKDMIFVEGQTVLMRFKLICFQLILSQFRKGNEAVQPVAINNITFPPNAPRPAPLSARNVSMRRNECRHAPSRIDSGCCRRGTTQVSTKCRPLGRSTRSLASQCTCPPRSRAMKISFR